jgi:pimeloyl-ACP methyl ester carboxylesterase
MTALAFTRTGSGDPLVLLHGLGLSRHSWDPVTATLAERYDVIAVDLPGFGDSAPLPAQTEASPATLAHAVGELLDDLGVDAPHVVGNSLGGWVALELARSRTTTSVTLLSPAGLWRDRTPLYCRVSLRGSRWLARHLTRLLGLVVGTRPGRTMVLGQTHGRPWRMSAARAKAVLREMGHCPGFDAALKGTAARRFRDGQAIVAPVTVAFGSRDVLLLRRQSRHLDQLPAHARVDSLRGCGHIPMTDDPAAVAGLVTSSCERASVLAGR